MATALPTVLHAKPSLSVTYELLRKPTLRGASAKPFICRPLVAASIYCGSPASNGVTANAWRAFRVYVGELEKSKEETSQLVRLE